MRCFVIVVAGSLLCSTACANVLYDAPSSNVRPDDGMWGWSYASIPSGAVVSGPSGAGYVTLDTTASNSISAGWLKTSPINLDRTVGYDAIWNLQVVSESHTSDNLRAGLSVFVLGNDHEGVEIGYWNNEVFVYNDDANFTIGESAALNTTAGMLTYDLNVSGNAYTLKVNGTAELSGNLRNYSSFGVPYNLPNTIWVGDDTSRGQSVSHWQSFAVTSAPEPAAWMALGLSLLAVRRRAKR